MKVLIEKGVLKSLTLTAATIEARDAYTGGHLWRVSQYSQKLAQAIGMTSKKIFLASLGGFLHDIGKIGIPDAILSKRGELTEAEYEVVKTHPGTTDGGHLNREKQAQFPKGSFHCLQNQICV